MCERASSLPVSKQCTSTTAGLQKFTSSGLKSMSFTKIEIDMPLLICLLILVHLWFMFSRFLLYSGGQWDSDSFFLENENYDVHIFGQCTEPSKICLGFLIQRIKGGD